MNLTKRHVRVTWRNIAKVLVANLPLPEHSPDKGRSIQEYLLGYDNQKLRKLWSQETFRTKVAEYERILKNLPKVQKLAIKTAYIFASKVPKQEREDMLQDLTLNLLEQKSDNERWAYVIARNNWADWWRNYQKHSQFIAGSFSQFEEYEYANHGNVLDDGNVLDLPLDEFETALDTANFASETRDHLIETWQEHDTAKRDKADRFNQNQVAGVFAYAVEFETQVIGKLDGMRLWEALPKDIRQVVSKRLVGKPTTSTDRMRLNRYVQSHKTWLIALAQG